MHIATQFTSRSLDNPTDMVCRRLAMPENVFTKYKNLIKDPARHDVQTQMLTDHLINEEGAYHRDENGVAGLTVLRFNDTAGMDVWQAGGILDEQDKPRIVSETFFEKGAPIVTLKHDSAGQAAEASFPQKGHSSVFRNNFTEDDFTASKNELTIGTGTVRSRVVTMTPTRRNAFALTA